MLYESNLHGKLIYQWLNHKPGTFLLLPTSMHVRHFSIGKHCHFVCYILFVAAKFIYQHRHHFTT